MMTNTWRILRYPIFIIAGLIAVFLTLLFYLWVSGRVWYPRQRRRVEQLAVEYESAGEQDTADAAFEDSFAAVPLDDDLPYNELRMIASHNSYHKEPDWIRRALIGMVEPEEPEKLLYSHQTLREQLDNGVRSFELDVRYRGRRFTVTHVPLVDNRGPHPDLPLTLREIRLWSESHPCHVPVIILFELKSDWMFLDPGLKNWDTEALAKLDVIVQTAFAAEGLITPKDILGGAASVSEAVKDGWPPLGDLRGGVICVVHTDAVIDELYSGGDPRLTGRVMFTSRSGSTDPEHAVQTGSRPDAAFVIHNEPDIESIALYTEAGLIVRTRADGDGSFTSEQRTAALASGAQIISTDLPPGHPNGPEMDVVEFAPGKTLRQR